MNAPIVLRTTLAGVTVTLGATEAASGDMLIRATVGSETARLAIFVSAQPILRAGVLVCFTSYEFDPVLWIGDTCFELADQTECERAQAWIDSLTQRLDREAA